MDTIFRELIVTQDYKIVSRVLQIPVDPKSYSSTKCKDVRLIVNNSAYLTAVERVQVMKQRGHTSTKSSLSSAFGKEYMQYQGNN